MSVLYNLLGRKIMFSVGAEQAHGLSIKALQLGAGLIGPSHQDDRLRISIAGLDFPNPLGMAAGYDKNGDVPDALLALGFGHTEVGTITPQSQSGNPKPRIFRLIEDGAVINRLGFNSRGHASAITKLSMRKDKDGAVGINIGANKTSENFAADYVEGIHCFANLATYFTINISSPNTPGLRALQGANPLSDLLQRVSTARSAEAEKNGRYVPLFLKIAPDLDENELDAITDAVSKSDFDGLIVSNTTLSRAGLKSNNKDQTGGLSGAPLFERSTIVLAKMRKRLDPDFPLIGVGGVHDADTAFSKIEAGASLVQLYTGLIYGGPGLPTKILKGLTARLDHERVKCISDVIGRRADIWAAKKLSAS